MKYTLTFIKQALKLLQEQNILQALENTAVFFDEPHYYYYSAILATTKTYTRKLGFKPLKIKQSAGGLSFWSNEEALSKCLGEAIERISLELYKEKDILYSTYAKLSDALNPRLYVDFPDIKNKSFGWVKAIDLISQKEVYIPAQTVFMSYSRKKEIPLCPPMSTGTAGGFNEKETILAALYEAIERDSYMTTYLKKIPAYKIDHTTLQNSQLQNIVHNILQYNLEVHIFDITNDLEISTYMTIVIDKTGIGPAITIGTKSGLNTVSTIVSSIAEALMARPYVRLKIYKEGRNNFKGVGKNIKTNEERLLFWSPLSMIEHLSFLINQPSGPCKISGKKLTTGEQIDLIVKKLSRKGFSIYYKEITSSIFKNIPYKIYRVVVPGLQPLYLDESRKFLNLNRLNKAADFFGIHDTMINQIPHPFL